MYYFINEIIRFVLLFLCRIFKVISKEATLEIFLKIDLNWVFSALFSYCYSLVFALKEKRLKKIKKCFAKID